MRNSLVDGDWGEEERDENLDPFTTPNPIVSGEKFKIYILVGDNSFHIAINDAPYCTYNFRMPLLDIHTVQVTRDLQAIDQIDHRAVFPSPIPSVQLEDPRVEFSHDIPRRFPAGKWELLFFQDI